MRPESIAVAATGFAYVAAVLILAPGYLRVAGWAARAYSSFHPSTPFDVAFSWRMGVSLAFLLAAPFLYRRGHRLAALSAAAVAALTVTVLIQNKGWPYHWLPAIGLIALTAGLVIPLRRTLTAALVVAAVLVAPRTAERWWAQMAGWPYYLPETMEAVEQYGGPVAALSTVMQSTFPLVNYASVDYASRFATLWPLPAFYERGGDPFPYHTRDEMEPLERYMFDAVLTDLETMDPALLIVDRLPPRAGPPGRELHGFNYFHYFGQDPRFRELISRYMVVRELGPYLLLARRDRVASLPEP